ncbi:MAG: hypothetical protein ABI824_09835 [Acidobacteriota bacterium]
MSTKRKHSTLPKMLALVLIVMILPSMVSALGITCVAPYCSSGPYICPDFQTDCSSDWVNDSWDNFCTAVYMWAQGYTVVACCTQ